MSSNSDGRCGYVIKRECAESVSESGEERSGMAEHLWSTCFGFSISSFWRT